MTSFRGGNYNQLITERVLVNHGRKLNLPCSSIREVNHASTTPSVVGDNTLDAIEQDLGGARNLFEDVEVNRNEIRRKIKLLKNSKFAGSDNVPANVLKADVKISLELLFSLFIQLLEKGDFRTRPTMDLGYGRMDPNISLPMDLHRSNPALNRGKYATGGLL
ncbi:hypothetical protein DPMN_155345 [Dreissena polymorpha]|uniref:Uncharacterized protein n=1 Tax=Dreissena polymorpha TaxID=45954 RepID=A0A9D4FRL6_DREPO|nr:hypothetical protein DPMN_155345 [Dreissena polymorpha]